MTSSVASEVPGDQQFHTSTHDPTEEATDIGGVTTEKVDSYTLQVIEQLFPRPSSGVQFLALLLRFARIKQVAFGEQGETTEAAAISVQSIRVLAKKIGWGYDTTQKYILLFCALGLLIKHRHRNQIELHFPLTRYQLTSVQQLDRIITKARPKVVSFTRQVRTRCLVLLRESPGSAAEPLPRPTQAAAPSEASILVHIPTTLDKVRALLESTQVDSQTRNHLLLGLTHILTLSSETESRLSHHTVDSQPPDPIPNGRLSSDMVDSEHSLHTRPSRLSEPSVDSKSAHQSSDGRLFSNTVDSPTTISPASGRLSSKKSTVIAQPDPQKGRLSGNGVDSQPKTVDSQREGPANVNVILSNVININVNVKDTIEFLRLAFGEPPTKRGYYYNLLKQYTHAEAWLAAAIETFIGLHRTKTVQDPGKWFYDRCVALHQTGIPPETQASLERYRSLTYKQLLEQLQTPTTAAKPTMLGSMHQRPVTRAAPVRPPIACRVPRQRQHTGMSKCELRDLLRMIQQDSRTCCFLTQAYRQTDGSCALLVDSGMHHQVFVYSPHEWRVRLAHLDHTKRIPDVFL